MKRPRHRRVYVLRRPVYGSRLCREWVLVLGPRLSVEATVDAGKLRLGFELGRWPGGAWKLALALGFVLARATWEPR